MTERSSTLTRTMGASLRRLRKARGVTQAQLAEATGLGAVQISRIERGVQEPRFCTIERIAEAMDVAPEEFWVTRDLPAPQSTSEPRVAEAKQAYARTPSRMDRRLGVFKRILSEMDPAIAEALLEGCMNLARHLQRKALPGRKRDGKK